VYPFERFTEATKRVLTLAQEEAERAHHSYIGTEHILLGLLRERDTVASVALDRINVDIADVRRIIDTILGAHERIVIQQIIPTSRVKTIIEISFTEPAVWATISWGRSTSCSDCSSRVRGSARTCSTT
jgi:ATP-dependent Clp protease ATP-binding subunit ClpC